MIDPNPRFDTLDDWLRWQEGLHPATIDLGLERVRTVFRNLRTTPPPFAVVTVAGTNGKGSSVAMLAAILGAAGYRVGTYTSPHLFGYNERICIDGAPVDDATLCAAFARVDVARQQGDEPVSLTYFEFGTLAALDIFFDAGLDLALLEVGLGGRLDAVNIIAPDVALVTAIDLDHQDYLGDDRETIAREKAGILRAIRPVVCSDADMPQAIRDTAEALGAPLYAIGEDFHAIPRDDGWDWLGPGQVRRALPWPGLRGAHQLRNAAGVLMAVQALGERFYLSQAHIREGLQAARLPGRFQVEQDAAATWIFDVAHNPQAVAALAENLRAFTGGRAVQAVFGALRNKDVAAMAAQLQGLVAHWHLVPTAGERGTDTATLATRLGLPSAVMSQHATLAEAMTAAAGAEAQAVVLVFGSFPLVGEAGRLRATGL